MNAEEMSPEQLMELARAKAGEVHEGVRVVDVGGLSVSIDDAKARSWQAFRLVSRITSDVTPETVDAIMGFLAMATDVDEARLVEHCGGESASIEQVLELAARILEACYPKN